MAYGVEATINKQVLIGLEVGWKGAPQVTKFEQVHVWLHGDPIPMDRHD